MVPPRNVVYVQGVTTLDDDGQNTFVQGCSTANDLRVFPGISGMSVLLFGIESVDDGLGGEFIWNATSTGPDDNLDTIMPYGLTRGAWVRLSTPGGVSGGSVTFTTDLPFRFDGGGSVPSMGVLGDGIVDFACKIIGWTIQADQAGAIALDIWKLPYATNTPPTISNTIVAAAPPAVAATNESARSSSLSGWTTAINAGDWLRFNLTSIATITRFTLTLSVSRTITVS